jgi:hypothetical protein
VSSLDRSSRTDKKFHSLTMGLYLFLGLLNMFEVMPMLMRSEMALKAIEMKKIAVFDGVCTRTSPSPSMTAFLQSPLPVLLLSTLSTRLEVVAEEEEEEEEEEEKDSRSGMPISYF